MTSYFSVTEIPYINPTILKVLVIGDYGVGKFSSNYKITIGAECSIKKYVYRHKRNVTVQFWDISGQERFNCMTRIYYKNACAAIVVFDLSRASTFNSTYKWLRDLREKMSVNDGTNVPVVLFANKSDIAGCIAPIDALDSFCRRYNIIGWYKTSAKNNINIDEAMDHLISATMDEMSQGENNNNDNISLHIGSETNSSLCC